MSRKVLLDAGPLVAFLDGRDRYNEWAMAQWASVVPPFLTCEPVLTEACFLVRHLRDGPRRVLEMVERVVVSIPFRLADDAPSIARLLVRYATVPISLADACLVRMSEQHSGSVVLTLDPDFRVYRRHGRHVIATIMPE